MQEFSWLYHLVLQQSLSALLTFSILGILQSTLNTLGYPAVTLFIMIESAGIPFPGETMLLLASFYSAIDNHLSLPIVIACAALGAIMGDNIGFYVGRTGGKAFIDRYGHYIHLKAKQLERAEKFFAKHGDKTVFFGRFVAVLRAWAAFIAGVNQMKWSTFFIYNATGGIVWAIVYGLLGYYAGRIFHNNFSQVEHLASQLSLILTITILAAAIGIFFLYRWRRKQG
jgi:membrane protein DedA with SNARE-associated domain